MSDQAVQFVMATFESEQGAEQTLSTLKAEKKAALKGVQAAVAMRNDAHGKIHYKDVGLTPTKGAVGGVVIGAVVGIATGGTGLALGALGTLLGSVIGKHKRENQIANEQVNQVVASLKPGSSALLTVVAQDAATEVEDLLHEAGGHTFSADISADLAAQLNEHDDAAYTALLEQIKP